MIKPFMLLFAYILLLPALYAQDTKDSTYHAKLSAPGTKMISVYNGKYKVFTQRVGDGKISLLLLHGGPENTHEYFEHFPQQLKDAGVTVYFYDQLGSYFSDTPEDSTIWRIDRFVEEVEEVRKGLGIDHFYLLGHSWGGMLAELYAAKYVQHLKGLILSNVPGFITGDSRYPNNILDSIDQDVRYRATLLPSFEKYKEQMDTVSRNLPLVDDGLSRILRKQYMKAADSLYVRTVYYHKAGSLPEPLVRNFKHIRYQAIERYHFNPFGADYAKALGQISAPTLLIGGKNDFLYPDRYPAIKRLMTRANVRVHICPDGAHFTMWDDADDYFTALKRFINEVQTGRFRPN